MTDLLKLQIDGFLFFDERNKMELSRQSSFSVEGTLCLIFVAGLLVTFLHETVISQSFIQLLFPISGKKRSGT